MSIGEGIVTATIITLLATGVFLISKNRKWGIVGKIAGGLFVLILAVGIGIWGFQSWKNRPQQITELWNISLGMTSGDVKIQLGEADRIIDHHKDKTLWFYQNYSGEVQKFIRFEADNDRVMRVSILCEVNGYTNFFGIRRYTSLQTIIKKLGEPSSESTSPDGLKRVISYKRYGVGFVIQKGIVEQLCASSSGEISFTNPINENTGNKAE